MRISPRRRRKIAGDHLDQRRLAGAVVAHQPENFAGFEHEVHFVERVNRAEVFRNALQLQNRHHASPSRLTRSPVEPALGRRFSRQGGDTVQQFATTSKQNLNARVVFVQFPQFAVDEFVEGSRTGQSDLGIAPPSLPSCLSLRRHAETSEPISCPSLRAKRSNPGAAVRPSGLPAPRMLWPLDCFVARAPRNDGCVAADPINSVVLGAA